MLGDAGVVWLLAVLATPARLETVLDYMDPEPSAWPPYQPPLDQCPDLSRKYTDAMLVLRNLEVGYLVQFTSIICQSMNYWKSVAHRFASSCVMRTSYTF